MKSQASTDLYKSIRKEVEKELEDSKIAARNVLEDLSIEKSKVEMAKAKDEAILESIGEGLIAVDNDKKIMIINKVASDMLEWKVGELIGSIVTDLPLEDEEGNLIPLEKRPTTIALETGNIVKVSYFFVRKNKTRFPMAITATPIKFGGKILGLIEIIRDITREKEVDKMKTEFVSMASHQLRTPLTAINWYVEMLQSEDVGELNANQKKYLEEIYKGSNRMVRLVNDLLNVSRIETGRLKVEPEMVDLVLFVEDIIRELKPWSKTLHREIVFKKSGISTQNIMFDQTLMRQVIHNMITNAVHYSPGSPSIDVVLESKVGECVVSVCDEGIGIPKEAQGRIFEKFFRADNAREIEGEGSGIGMYISKSITDACGAKLWFESPTVFKEVAGKKVGYGTTFYLSIPTSGMSMHEGERFLG